MKIIVIDATGTIGAKVTQALAANGHEASDRPCNVRQNPGRRRSAGNAAFKPFAQLTDADYELGLRSKLMGQVSLARIATDQLRDGGSITLTTGILAMHPMPG
jgi:hypothetical protein